MNVIERAVQAIRDQVGDGGVDLVDCSSGALSPAQQIALGPGYQVPFASAIRCASIARR